MANPDKIRLIKSYNPHCFTGGETPSPATVDVYVRNESGAPILATAIPVVEVVDERKLLVNLKDHDFEAEDIEAIVDVCTPCPEYAEPPMAVTTPVGAPAVVDPPLAPSTTTV